MKAHYLQPDDTYQKPDKRGKNLISSQDYFCQEALRDVAEKKKNEDEVSRVFEPMYHNEEE